MHRFIIIDAGLTSYSQEDIYNIGENIIHERNNMWGRFNTINRADTSRVLDNLCNMVKYDQTSIFHNKFSNKAAVIVCPGPSLEKNVDLLKKIQGRVVIICVLHALKELTKRGIKPDFVVHVDPGNLKDYKFKKGNKEQSYWDEWLPYELISNVENFVVSTYCPPEMFDVPAKNVVWMSTGLPIGEHLPGVVYDYDRVGGSVSHSCFDLAIEMGCSTIVLVGQDLAFSKEGDRYSKHAKMDESKETKISQKAKVYGNDVEVKGWFGDQVVSNNTFLTFMNSYIIFARQLKDRNIKLLNCTEGGVFIEGFEHLRLNDFINCELSKDPSRDVSELLNDCKTSKQEREALRTETMRYIAKKDTLAKEIAELIRNTMQIAEKTSHSDKDLRRFDKLQNKLIKRLKKNMFYSMGLQRDIHIFQAGVKADPTLKGQLSYHLDFLKVAKSLNRRFKDFFTQQAKLLKNL